MNTVVWWLVQNSLTVALMLPFVMLACRLYRERPAVQHLLWLVVLLKFLTPPIVTWPWSLQDLREAVTPANRVSLMSGHTEDALSSVPPALAIELLESASRTAEHSARQDLSTRHESSASIGFGGVIVAARVAFALWLGGMAICGGLQMRLLLLHARLVRRGMTAPELLRSGVRSIAKDLGLRPPLALVSRGIVSPFVWCLGSVRLVWPEVLSSRAEIARSRGVIAHELAHLRRKDHWVAWLELAAGIAWWWNPLYWYVRRQLRESAEMACDALAISTCPTGRKEYAEMLLELSAGFKTGCRRLSWQSAPAPLPPSKGDCP